MKQLCWFILGVLVAIASQTAAEDFWGLNADGSSWTTHSNGSAWIDSRGNQGVILPMTPVGLGLLTHQGPC